jgi:hypothetical protein
MIENCLLTMLSPTFRSYTLNLEDSFYWYASFLSSSFVASSRLEKMTYLAYIKNSALLPQAVLKETRRDQRVQAIQIMKDDKSLRSETSYAYFPCLPLPFYHTAHLESGPKTF